METPSDLHCQTLYHMNWAEKKLTIKGTGLVIQVMTSKMYGVEGDVDGNGPIPPVEDDHAAQAKMVGFDILEVDGN